jgi:phosphatidylglycerophosphate synthase
MKARDFAQKMIYKIIDPFVELLIKLKATPNIITTIGLLLNILASIVFIIGGEHGKQGDLSYIGWGSWLILFAGLFDMLDGQVARIGKMSSRFGALYDSVLDRYSELFMFLGICYYLVAHHYFLSSLFAFIALIGSMMVSYTRARAEGLGVECKEGLMQRPERIIIISISGIVCGIVSAISGGNQKLYFNFLSHDVLETISIFTIPIAVVAILSNITAIKRLNYCRKKLNGKI